MFERYTENARRAIYFARTEALARGSSEIETKDLLLGLTYKHYEEASPFSVLRSRREELRTLMCVPPISKMPEAKDIPLTRQSKIALAYAAREVDKDKQFSLEPHHLLRGIVLVGDNTAVALVGLGWDIETLRNMSLTHRKLFPTKRPSMRRILKFHVWAFFPSSRQLIKFAAALALLLGIIFYLRWQQR